MTEVTMKLVWWSCGVVALHWDACMLHDPVAAIVTQVPAAVCGKAVEDSPSTWAPSTPETGLAGVPDFCLRPDPALAVAGIWERTREWTFFVTVFQVNECLEKTNLNVYLVVEHRQEIVGSKQDVQGG